MKKLIVRIYGYTYKFLPVPVRRFFRNFRGSFEDDDTTSNKAFYENLGIIRPGDLVFDIGANRGLYTQIFLELGARVVAVEPLPECIEILWAKFKDRIAILPYGVADKADYREMFVAGTTVASTFSEEFKTAEEQSNKTDYTDKIRVKMTTLDELIGQYGMPRYCKIDVEGYEKNVLRGLSRKIPFISFEYHKEDEALELCKLLNERGYGWFTQDSSWYPYEDFINAFKAGKGGDIFAKVE